MKKLMLVILLLLHASVFESCFNIRKASSEDSKYYGVFAGSTAGNGKFREYLLIEPSHKVYYILDSLNYCSLSSDTFKNNYWEIGSYRIIKDSITFEFDSCLQTTSIGNIVVRGEPLEIKTRTFKKNYRQWYEGAFSGNELSFSITTVSSSNSQNDTIYRKDVFTKCR